MKARLFVAVALFAACAAPPPPRPAVTPALQPQPSTNALTQIPSVPKTIAEPRIRVGMVSEQTSVTFPRVDGGYYLITDSGASTLRRGFTDTAPLSDKSVRYAVQAGAISDKPS